MADEPILLLTAKSAELLSSHFYQLSFYAHISLGGIALLIGWLQFIDKIRMTNPKVHRFLGKIYIGSVLISGPFGFNIALHASGGISAKMGFLIGAVIWTAVTLLGFLAIKKGKVDLHRKLLMFSYAGTFGAVTLRLWLPLLIALTGSFSEAYDVVAWLSWLPNLAVVYLYINHKDLISRTYKKYKIKYVLASLFILTTVTVGVSYMSPQTWLYKGPSFEGTAFERKSPSEPSLFTEEKLEEIDTYLKEESETTSMIVLENGKIVFEYGDVSEISYISSCRKSVLAMLYGKHVADGTIDLEETIGEIGIDEDDGLLPLEKKATVEHVITSRSGVFHKAANGGYDERNIRTRGSVQPGEYFVYNNWDFNVAGHILEKKTGKSVYQEMEEQLALPLGFQDWHIENQTRTANKDKSRYSAYHMHPSTRDMAKIGQLMLQEGKWNNEQLIPQDWLKKITSPVTHQDTISQRYGRDNSSPLLLSYGYMWWIFERLYDNPDFEGAFNANGFGGQYITVIPKRNVVIAHKTKLDLLGTLGISERSATPPWRYWWILRNLMLHRKSISELATNRSTDEVISLIRKEYDQESEYAISERLINEYAQEVGDSGKMFVALQFFKLNLELYPKGWYTHRTYDYMGYCLEQLGRREDAIEAYERSLDYHSNNSDVQRKLTNLLEGKKL